MYYNILQKDFKRVDFKSLFDTETAELLQPDPEILVSEWAQKNRVLPDKDCAAPGPWKNELTPYLKGFMDACVDRNVDFVGGAKGVQMGFTEALYNILGRNIRYKPGPAMLVTPDKNLSDKSFNNRLKPLIDESKELAQYKTGNPDDFSMKEIRLTNMNIYPAWSGSASALSSTAIKDVYLDETAKFPEMATKREGDPVELAKDRTTTYAKQGLSTIVAISTPSETGDCLDKQRKIPGTLVLKFWVPCPHCGKYQILEWRQIKRVDNIKDPERILNERLAYYECVHCKKHIESHLKLDIMQRGVWASENAEIDKKGKWKNHKKSSRLFFWINILYSPWKDWWDILAKFYQVKHDKEQLKVFINQWLAEWWTEGEKFVTIVISDRKEDYVQGVVPATSCLLTATIDTQATHFYYVIRAWGKNEQSWLIRQATANTFDDLERNIFNTAYYYPNQKNALSVAATAIDTAGGRESDVYAWCRESQFPIIPCKGKDVQKVPFYFSSIDYHQGKNANLLGGVELCMVHTNYMKDRLFRMIHNKISMWHIPKDVSQAYMDQMVAEKKTTITNKRGRPVEVWHTVPDNAPNHYWDCEVLQVVLSEYLGLRFNLKDDTDFQEYLSASNFNPKKQEGDKSESENVNEKINKTDNWIYGNRNFKF